MSEEPHVEEAAQAQLGTPEPAMDGPTGVRKVVRGPTATHLHDGNAIAFLHQAMGRNTPAEAGSDDDEVKIELVVAGRHRAARVAGAVLSTIRWLRLQFLIAALDFSVAAIYLR